MPESSSGPPPSQYAPTKVISFLSVNLGTVLQGGEDSENEALPPCCLQLLFLWLCSSPVAGLLGPSLSESCLLVLWGPPESLLE